MTLENLVGCVLGQCAGDALGFPVEGMPPEICTSWVDRVVLGGALPEDSVGRLTFGQYTDDSQLMRELLRSFVASGGFEPEHYAQRIARLFSEELVVGRGASTERSAKRLADGVPWDEAGEPPPMAGNGSAMRSGVVGLLAADDAELVRMAVDQGRITHRDPRCGAGCVAIAGACSRVAEGRPLDVDELAELVALVDGGFADHLVTLREWVALPPEDAVGLISGVPGDFDRQRSGITPFVVSSVLWSIYAYLRSPHDFIGAVSIAIRVGGDVDTTAAMTGAIAGAALGAGAVPEWIKNRVNDRGRWGRDELESLASRAFALAKSG